MINKIEYRILPESEKYPISCCHVLIFAGGIGSRARELTHGIGVATKHLLPINYSGQTLLDYSVQTALSAGIRRINLIISGITSSAIVPHCKLNYPLYDNISVFEHDIPTAGVAQVFELFVKYNHVSGPIIKLEGDELNADLDLADMYQAHVDGGHPITYLATKGGNSYKYKLFVNSHGLVSGVKKAPFNQFDEINGYNLSGTFIINPSMLDLFFRSGSTYNFLLQATAQKKLYIYHHKGASININTPKDYAKITIGRGY